MERQVDAEAVRLQHMAQLQRLRLGILDQENVRAACGRRCRRSFAVSLRQPQDLAARSGRGAGCTDAAHADRRCRHAVDDGGALILGKGVAAGLAHLDEALRPVLAHAGENDAESPAVRPTGRSTGTAWWQRGAGCRRGGSRSPAGCPRRQEQMPVAGRHIDAAADGIS